jgi:serine/threonine protein kinase
VYGRPGMEIPPNLRLVRRMREGGMGAVWLAENRALSTKVVVKFLGAEHAKDESAAKRFRNEAAAASRVKSPHVVQIFDHGVTKDGIPFIVMELLEGRDLAEHVLRNGPMPPKLAADMIAQIARALTKAHEVGIIHRDIKPENIFLTDVGPTDVFAKLLDFGIARAPELNVSLTTDKESILGTPNYMSPEQMQGEPLDPRTDVWSLGLCAFEAITGTRAFPQTIMPQLALAVCHAPLPLPTDANPDVPEAVDAWFLKACARDREKRYASARELADALVLATSATPDRAPVSRGRLSKEDLLTRYAREASDLSVEFIKALGGVKIAPDFIAELAAPESPSTADGAHATQQIRLISRKPGVSSLKVGSVDVKGALAVLRSFDHLDRVHRKRFGASTSLDRESYDAFVEEARKFFEASGNVVELTPPTSSLVPPAPRAKLPVVPLAIALAVVLAAVVLVLVRH